MSNKPLAQFFNILYLNRCFLIYPLFDFNVFLVTYIPTLSN